MEFFFTLTLPDACLSLILSVGVTCWPLRVSFALSRNAFEAVALRVRSGERVSTPSRIGLFRIRQAELSNGGVVCLWTDLDPAGHTGFVQCDQDKAVKFNLWSIIPLEDRWQFISED